MLQFFTLQTLVFLAVKRYIDMDNQQTINYSAINTFSRSPTYHQISTYLIVILQIIVYFLMIRPNIVQHSSALTLTVLFSASLGFGILFSFICCKIDPSDRCMIQSKKLYRKQDDLVSQHQKICAKCHCIVSKTAKHCTQCNRCVQFFDHHCPWINNCIGDSNYKIFMMMIISIFVHFSFFIISVIILSFEKNWHSFLSFIIVSWITLVIVVGSWAMLLQLIVLHFYLSYKGYTTYQFIMMKKLEQIMEQKKKKERENNLSRENVVVIDIQREGHSQLNISQLNIDVNDHLPEKKEEIKNDGINENQRNNDNSMQQDQNKDNDQWLNVNKFFTKNKSYNLMMSQQIDIADEQDLIRYSQQPRNSKKQQQIKQQLSKSFNSQSRRIKKNQIFPSNYTAA